MLQWMQEPGRWNDGIVLCSVMVVVCLVGMIVGCRIEKRKSWKRGEL